ncbi:M14 family zinc carboxypeptidase [Mycolicibacterium austroafricanum]|uniref:M14 family zinc carboxypeptidase n=1 Tax=Mycolicibacterium austroafricanum TaxID=39687 RepID=UPI002E2A4D8B|nr:M14 family zinc carboxypeptidase [Mycolicibacterium austroafricanum]
MLTVRRPVGVVLAVFAFVVLGGVQACSVSSSDAPGASSSAPRPEPTLNATTSPSQAVHAQSPPPGPVPPGWQTVGTSLQGRPIRALTVGQGPRKVVFIGGIHGDEAEGAIATAELPAAFESAGLGGIVTLTVIEDANPDGRVAGTRGNAHGVDINRNFPASNFDSSDGGKPLSEPETRVITDTVDRVAPNLVVVAHSWSGRQFINFDGPAREIADRFAAASGLPVEESRSFAPTPGSLGSYFGRDRGIPTLTVEVLKGSDPRTVWEQLRPALLQAVRG